MIEGRARIPKSVGWLIVGLGNPGESYESSRHNLGFMLIDLLARKFDTVVKRRECQSLIGRGRIEDEIYELAKPQTFMNLSGDAVRCLVAKKARSISKTLIISDDIALPLGVIRIREQGSAGGQKGLGSVIKRLGTSEFCRLRIGIAPEHQVADITKFVLDDFSSRERLVVNETLEKGVEAVESVIVNGVARAMSEFNSLF